MTFEKGGNPMGDSIERELGRDDLIAAFLTLSGSPAFKPARFPFAERVASAAAAGFAAIGLDSRDYAACREAGHSDAEMRSVLDDHGIRVAELEFVADWLDEPRVRQSEERLYAAADAFGARHINVGTMLPPGALPDFEIVAERFAALCDRAEAHALRVALEFLPWTAIPDAGIAWEIVELAGRVNGGVLVDSWHYFRGAADPGQLRTIPPNRIVVIQFDDADEYAGGDLLEDTMNRRLPGQGAFDLVGFIRLLDSIGVTAPISVEIISPEHQARPVSEAAKMAYDTSRAVIANARSNR
jgi:sugar phosphate isomerase/epimerase